MMTHYATLETSDIGDNDCPKYVCEVKLGKITLAVFHDSKHPNYEKAALDWCKAHNIINPFSRKIALDYICDVGFNLEIKRL